MKKDMIKLYGLELMLIVFLFFTLFASNIITRIILAIILLGYTILVSKVLIKRNKNTIYEKQTVLLMLILASIYISVFYLLGLYFGFTKSKIIFSFESLYKFIIPLTIIIISSEIMRKIFLSQKGSIIIFGHKINFSIILTYIAMVLVDLKIFTDVYDLSNLDDFLKILGFVLFSSLSCNLLYNYISRRFGYIGIIIYRLITIMYIYIIPITPDVHILIRTFLRMITPFIIFIIIENLYPEKVLPISFKSNKKGFIITIIIFILLSSLVMLISCKFKYGIMVVGSNSMNGTLNKGDAVIFEKYYNQRISPNKIIIFDYNGITTIHRVVKIENINGEKCYYTKGDANKYIDSKCITQEKIKGLVNLRIKYIGKPTIWVRELFSN